MNQQLQEIFKGKHKQGQKIALTQLRHRSKINDKVDEETIDRLQKLKKYALHDSSIPTQKLNNYFCSLCGRIGLVTNILLQTLPKRKTDGSTAIQLKSNFVKLNFQKQKIRHIRRQSGAETQYRWKCQCGITVGYMCINYDQLEELRQNCQFKCSNRPFLYIYQDALTQKMRESKLMSQLITYKQTILLHLKKRNTNKK